MTAEGSDYWGDGWREEASRCLPVEVPEEWQGLTLLSEGPFFPDDDPGIGTWGRPGPWGGPWRFHEAKGMRTYDDEPYQWTLCSQCGSFGAEFCGYAERLSCGCLDDREHSKVAGGSDKRLLADYPAAQLEQWHADDFTAAHAIVLLPTVREALVQESGAAAVAANCAGECRSLAEQLRQEQCPPAAGDSDGLETLCSACPWFVCGQCGERPVLGRCAGGGVEVAVAGGDPTRCGPDLREQPGGHRERGHHPVVDLRHELGGVPVHSLGEALEFDHLGAATVPTPAAFFPSCPPPETPTTRTAPTLGPPPERLRTCPPPPANRSGTSGPDRVGRSLTASSTWEVRVGPAEPVAIRVPVGDDSHRWASRQTRRRVLLVVHNVTSAGRLLDVLPLFHNDFRVQLLVTSTGSSAFQAGVGELFAELELP
ncbi:hypothetical protein ACWGJV_39210, partial [Streptomyces tendae]